MGETKDRSSSNKEEATTSISTVPDKNKEDVPLTGRSVVWASLKLVVSVLLLVGAFSYSQQPKVTTQRRLTAVASTDDVPTYMEDLMKDLQARYKLFDETPPEEVKYWFEYTGPLQVSFVGRVLREASKKNCRPGRGEGTIHIKPHA